MLRTTYKSPSSVHIFGFSSENIELFPSIPPSVDPTVIRTQIDLQGWSVEALSPNTTQVTLLEQSDPRGWSNKSSIPQVMMTTLAGIGEFAIKHGGPPIATRLGGAKALISRYDVEKESYRVEYEATESRRSNSSSTSTAFPLAVAVRAEAKDGETSTLRSLDIGVGPQSNIECEIRCDADKWATNFMVVIDPPHQAISALKRHRLSPGGGGLWLTIEHDPIILGTERVVITVKRGASVPGGKTTVSVNGSKVKVDAEDLPEADVQLLKKQKRSKPTRAPLDQPPALGTLRRRQTGLETSSANVADPFKTITPASALSRIGTPLARFYSVAAESTRAAIAPMSIPSPAPEAGSTPVDAAVRALTQLARMNTDRDGESTDPFGWQPISDRDGLKVEKRIVSHVSETFPVYRSGRIIEGFTAEDVSAVVSMSRKDERFDTPLRLQSHGHGITTSFLTAYTAFPFRGRGVLLSTIVAKSPDGPPPSPSSTGQSSSLATIFHASSSGFDPSATGLDPAKYNPMQLPMGSVILEGWILETIDPYSHEQYAIPSTRCMYVAAVDYGGSMPVSVNNILNGSLPRSLLSIESILKTQGAPSRSRSPPMAVLVPDSSSIAPWGLEGIDRERIGVEERNEIDSYALTVIIQPTPKQPHEGKDNLYPNSSKASTSTVIDLAEDIRRGRKDLVVIEVEIGTALVRAGSEISLKAISLPFLSSSDPLPMDLPDRSGLELPFKCTVVALAPSVLQSASLEPHPARHLLRVTLPTSGYEAPIADPLTGKTAPLPRPRWLLDLINDGAVVRLTLKARSDGLGKYLYGELVIGVEDEKRIQSRISSRDSRGRLAQLVNRETPGCTSLERALAVAREHLLEPSAPVIESPSIEISSIEPVASVPEVPPPSVEKATASRPPLDSSNRYSFWNYNYSRLTRFQASPSPEPSPLTRPTAVLSDSESPLPSSPVKISTLMPSSTMSEPTTSVSLPVLVIACLVCLLVGSLLRSLLSEADYVIYLPAGKPFPSGESWREMTRLLEWRIWWRKTLVVALARRE
ncbi:hypothetical protein P7C73_g2671, partial [Tremellales sp. Uapishka_1]